MKFADAPEADVAEYRAVSGLAVAGAVLAVASAVVLIEPAAQVVWSLPAIGLLLNTAALLRIARHDPPLVGRTAALAGLFLSVMFLVAAPVGAASFRRMLADEARQVADAWFAYLAEGQPHKAHQIALHPRHRQLLDERLWQFYRTSPQ